MTIREDDFILTPINDSSPMYDLELLYTVRPKGKESREEFKNAGYGLTLYNAVQKIANFRVRNKHKEEAIKLVTYIKELKDELNKLRKYLGDE